MERVLRLSLSMFVVLLAAASLQFTACSDDTPADPPDNPPDTTGNNDTNTIIIEDKVRPVVFAHGFIEAADVYAVMTQLFAQNGYQENQLHAFDFVDYLTGSAPDVEKMAQQLTVKVDAVIAATGTDKVDVVAHAIGAQALQYYLTQMGGTDKVAHAVFAGPVIDPALNFAGDITPAPVKYMTLRSNGMDALQLNNPSAGMMDGADNQQLDGMDNIQLVTSSEAFAKCFSFFTGETAAELTLHAPIIGKTYELKGKVINMIDNTPVADALVFAMKIRVLQNGEIQRQSAGEQPVLDDQGGFTYNDLVGLDQYLEFRVVTPSGSHYDMHIYRQPFRAASTVERIRVVPRSGGSQLLADFSSSLRTGDHGITLVYSQNHALYYGSDVVEAEKFDTEYNLIEKVDVLTPQNAPVPGSSAAGMNTFYLCLLDYDGNQQNGTGPVAAQALNMFGINSYDLLLNAEKTNYQTRYLMNGLPMGTANWRSSGNSGSSNSGFNLVQWEYTP